MVLRLFCIAALFLMAGGAFAADRVALVIGNGAYQSAPALTNPANDANAISDVLNGMGFEVIKGVDLDEAGMEQALRKFVNAMKDARVVLFYYSGHGLQVGGKNYLIPVDASLEDEAALDFETIDADKVFGYMGGNDRIALAFLDACRDNPFARSLGRSGGLTRGSVEAGLAAPETLGNGLFIGFSTAPNDTAADGKGANSPFTTAMVRHLPTPGLEINQVLTRVKADVRAATNNRQRPWTNSDLMSDFYLAPQGNAPAVAAVPPALEPPSQPENQVEVADPAYLAGGQSLLLEASDTGKTGAVPFSGTITWRRGLDEGGQPMLVGEALIPARNLKVSVLIRKNSDASLPASHLMEINFTVAADFVGGAVAGLPGVLLKNEELVQGTPLVGASARVAENSFLFAMSASAEDISANVDLMSSRKWMDLALIYVTGKRAILTIEKDDAAVTLFNDVLAEWRVDSAKDEKADMVVRRSEGTSSTEAREVIVRITDNGPLKDILKRNKVSEAIAARILAALRNVLNSQNMPAGAVLRILLQASGDATENVVGRLSIYFPDSKTGEIKHAATAALTDRGNYVLGLAPPDIDFTDGSLVSDPNRIDESDANGKVDRDRNLASAN